MNYNFSAAKYSYYGKKTLDILKIILTWFSWRFIDKYQMKSAREKNLFQKI